MTVHCNIRPESQRQSAEGFTLTECPNKAWAISCPRIKVSWWTSATASSIPVNMNTSPFYTKENTTQNLSQTVFEKVDKKDDSNYEPVIALAT